MADRLEPEFAPHFNAWKADPTPDNAAALLGAVSPVVSRAVGIHVGKAHPLIESRARRMALEGLRSYDPAGASLKTYLTGHLQGLKRVNRRQTTILKVPERVSLDRYHLDAAVKDYEAVHGVEPSDGQLADHAGFSVDRIRRVRSYRPAAAEGTVEAATGGDVFGASSPFAPKGETAWQKLVYDDLAPADQRVVDMHRAGLPNQEIARRLGVTPGAVSQRKARIQALFDQEDDLSPF